MKIEAIKPTNQLNIFKKVESFILKIKVKIKGFLEKDVFEKKQVMLKSQEYPNSIGGKKVLHQGDKFQHEYLKTRDVPNCISTSEDAVGTKLKKVLYYPEDIAKMEKMSKAEVKQYKKFLKQNGKYYYNNNDTYIVPSQNKSYE